MTKTPSLAAPARSPTSLRWLLTALLVGAVATVSLSASAQSAAAASSPGVAPSGGGPTTADGMRHGMHRGGEHGRGGMHHGMREGMHRGMGPEGMFHGSPQRMSRRIDRMLDGLGTSDAQRAQIKQIAAAAATDLRAQAEQGKGLREQSMRIFTAPQVDVNAAEQLRQQRLQQRDRMSRRVTQAMIDASQVLTPEQRVKLGERMRDGQARRADRMKRMSEAASSRHGERR